MSTKDNLLATARRIAALANRGEGGERVNAEKLLGDFLRKHRLSAADLEATQTSTRIFPAPATDLERDVVVQCIASCADIEVKGRFTKGKLHSITAELSPSQYAEASVKIAVMLPLFQKEIRTFLRAFVITNELQAIGTPPKEPSKEDIAEYVRASLIGQHLKRGQVHKALEPKSERT